jgi:hypothetical protein
MSDTKCAWCRRSYDPWADGMRHEEKRRFCCERCRYEARSSGWQSDSEKIQEYLASLPPKSREQQEWADAEKKVEGLSVLLALAATIMFMRTIFPSLVPSLAKFVLAADGTRTLFPPTIPEWIATVIFYAIPIPIGWAAWIFCPIAYGLIHTILTVIVKNFK